MRAAIRQILFGQTPFNPRQLFAAGEQGVWYDPSDWTTLFQDSAGTTPVTAIEQPVGLILDKSKGLVLGSNIVTNGDFSGGTTTGWTASSATLSIVSGKMRVAGTASAGSAYQAISVTAGSWYKITTSITVISGTPTTGTNISVRDGTDPSISNPVTATSFVAFNDSTLTAYFLAPSTATVYVHARVATGSGTVTADFDDIAIVTVAGNHAFQSTTTSRPILRQEAGGQYYLAFDGSDDWLQTADINFSATDKMSVFAGVRKLSDAALGVIAEISISAPVNNGSFNLYNNNSAAYGPSLRGSTLIYSITSGTLSAPITNVLTELFNIGGTTKESEVIMRVNSVQNTLTGWVGTNAGTGNFGTYPLYIGSRAGNQYPFNGRIYSFIIRGALTSSPQLEQTERWVAGKTGVTL